jgi:hypothetical protein
MNQQWIEKRLRNTFEDLYDILGQSGAILAGGALTSLYSNKEINDYDIYFPSEESMMELLEEIKGDFSFIVVGRTKKSILLRSGEKLIQLICNKYYSTVEEIFNNFDFYINMAAFEFKTGELKLHDKFLVNLASRNLDFNINTLYPIITALRVNKYLDRGYTISKKDFLRIMLCVNKLQIESWEDLKDHLSGLYGEQLEKSILTTDKEFSIDNALEILEALDSNVHTKQFSNLDIGELLLLFSLEKKWKGEYVWKFVNKSGCSPYAYYAEINYEVGTIVNGGENGIYCHCLPDEKQFRYRSSSCTDVVVLKKVDGSVMRYTEGETIVEGDWLVYSKHTVEDFKDRIKDSEFSKLFYKDDQTGVQ